MSRRYNSLEDRLLANSYVADEPACQHEGTPCWIWIGSTNSSGYPVVTMRQGGKVKRVLAHRLSIQVFRGLLPGDGEVAKHLCNVKRCINPMHLEFDTQSVNIRQCVEDGRHFSPFRKG